MAEREITPTHSAFLELREERAGMQEGYGFLDEKRLILAAEILAELARYEQMREGFRLLYTKAAAGLRAALARHGVEGLEIYPKAAVPCKELRVESRSVLGVRVQAADWETGDREMPPRAVGASPEADEGRDSFVDLVLHAARLAVHAGNLERLRLEYSRTARRARALEDVLLPEIDESLRLVEGALEEMEREEAMRVRQVRSTA
jgi:V/A-type H+/Na+-transporting ATPase subunit D